MSRSQRRNTTHPRRRSSRSCRRSRARFALILAIQYSAFQRRERFRRRTLQSRPCQKSPSQKTQSRLASNTKSGRPGSAATCFRGRSPIRRSSAPRSASAAPPVARFLRFSSEWKGDLGLNPANEGALGVANCNSHSRERRDHGSPAWGVEAGDILDIRGKAYVRHLCRQVG